MNGILLRAVMGAVRLWTKTYTHGLPPELRDARRAEIASDLWHGAHDPDVRSTWTSTLYVALRLLLGVPDDLGWRSEHVQPRVTHRIVRAAVAACIVCMSALGGAATLWRTEAPPLPEAPRSAVDAHLPPPPPPPPPPAVSADTGAAESSQPAWSPVYGDTSYTVTGNGVAPVKLKDVRPVYPPIAIAADVEGIVVVHARITEAGRVIDARVEQPAGILTHSAINAVKQWEFQPWRSDNASPDHMLRVQVRFTRPVHGGHTPVR